MTHFLLYQSLRLFAFFLAKNRYFVGLFVIFYVGSLNLKQELERKATKVLKLYERGIKVIFPEINKIKEKLLKEREFL